MTERHIKVELVRVDDDAYGPAVGWWEVRVDGETVHSTDDGSEASGDTARAFLADLDAARARASTAHMPPAAVQDVGAAIKAASARISTRAA